MPMFNVKDIDMDIKIKNIIYMRGSWASRRDVYHAVDLAVDPTTKQFSYDGGNTWVKTRPSHVSLCRRFTAIHKDEIDPKTNESFYSRFTQEYDGVPEDMMVCGHCLKKVNELQ